MIINNDKAINLIIVAKRRFLRACFKGDHHVPRRFVEEQIALLVIFTYHQINVSLIYDERAGVGA